jgi:hypothetical protein
MSNVHGNSREPTRLTYIKKSSKKVSRCSAGSDPGLNFPLFICLYLSCDIDQDRRVESNFR